MDGVTCQIESGQRIALVGRNGVGKSTFLKLLTGEAEPDDGEVRVTSGVRLASLPQEVPENIEGVTDDIVRQGLFAVRGEADPSWKSDQSVEQTLSRMQLDPDARFETLSSGMKRRVLLACAIVSSPDLLLLDEPTNHLDLPAIAWLEDFLLRWEGTTIFVTHDRMFLRKLASRILEIDRGRLFDWSCDYDTFLERKEAELAALEKHEAEFDKKLKQEEIWVRQGVKERRVRNEGRVRRLKAMRQERSERHAPVGKVRMQLQTGQRSGNRVAKVENVSFAYGVNTIVSDFSTTITRGDKVGILGPNGAGKTTLVRLLLGELEPQSGSVLLGTNIEVAYFDQLRAQLDEDKTIEENVGEGYDSIKIDGRPRHILGYLQDFLFTPERARTEVRLLSGGERNRVLLAKLFKRPANVIVLDEPTNDLDTETLELLEDWLVKFEGTVLAVSHDREFLNNVVTSTIVFEEHGVHEYVGGYDDWLVQRPPPPGEARAAQKKNTHKPSPSTEASDAPGKKKLTYAEEIELKKLPDRIEELETEISAIHEAMAQPSFYDKDHKAIAEEQSRLEKLESELATVFSRWEDLESRAEP